MVVRVVVVVVGQGVVESQRQSWLKRAFFLKEVVKKKKVGKLKIKSR